MPASDDKSSNKAGAGERFPEDRGDVKNSPTGSAHDTRPTGSSHGSQAANEGEGNKTADRHYRDGVKRTVESGKVEGKAKAAEKALEGSEGAELRRAEEKGKSRSHGEDPALNKKK